MMFDVRNIMPFPSQVIIDVTERCNYACTHCFHKDFVKSDVYTGADLDPALNKKLVDEVATDGLGYCEYLRYTANGEPLLHKGIMQMLEYACKHSKTRINLTTNGSLLDENRAREIVDMGVTVVDTSLDAFNRDTYSKIRVNGDLDKTRENVLRLIDYIRRSGAQTKVVVSYIEQPINRAETDDFKNFWELVGADYVVIRKLHSNAGAKKKIKEAIEKTNNGVERRPCRYPWERLVLTPTGYIGYCPVDWTNRANITDFRSHSIAEIWNDEYMQRLRKAHMENDYSHFPLCDNCPDWVYSTIDKDGRYGDLMENLPKDLLE